MTTDGQESRGQQPYEPRRCECAHPVNLHVINAKGQRAACSASTCDCRRYIPATKGPEETLLTLSLPLGARLVAELLKGIGEGAQRAGYTDVAMLTDGSNQIVARRAVA